MTPAEYKALKAKSAARDAQQVGDALVRIARDEREALRFSAIRDALQHLSVATQLTWRRRLNSWNTGTARTWRR